MSIFTCAECGIEISLQDSPYTEQETVYDNALGPGRVVDFCSYACYEHLHDGQEEYQQCPACERSILPTLANFPEFEGDEEICTRCINERTV
jgi:hypothetical protein